MNDNSAASCREGKKKEGERLKDEEIFSPVPESEFSFSSHPKIT